MHVELVLPTVRKLMRLTFGLMIGMASASLSGQESQPARLIPWTTSRVNGSPDPPLPYKTERVFAGVELTNPTNITWLPSANKWIANHAGSKIVMFDNDPENAVAEPLLDLTDVFGKPVGTGYTIKFHPDLENQPWCFVVFTQRGVDKGHHLARLTVVDPTVPKVDPDSLEVMATWKSDGHVGSSMQFGPDGMLYVSVGDGQPPYPPDGDGTGQDNSDLRASILRIDVNDPPPGKTYRIPPDNPFVNQSNVRGEIWAFGFRNPWKIAFSPRTGDLLAADVGWEMREIIHRVDRGRIHGWSIMEGTQPVKQDQQPAIPITPPLFEHTHLDSRSISGGHFWQSDRLPELKDAYLYGDWMTGKVWALRSEGDRVLWQKELVDTPHRVISFMLDPSGDVLIVGYDGTILRLHPNVQTEQQQPFPKRLSETGLFANVADQKAAVGVEEYQISAHHWADGTHSRQWIGLPGDAQLKLFKRADWKTGQTAGRFEFPTDTVVAKTVSYFAKQGDAVEEQHLETQVLHKYGDEWRAYNYVWNEDQTDAILQADEAVERSLNLVDPTSPGGVRKQTWRHASRSECLLCHIWAAGTVHAFWPEQLNISILGENQLDRFRKLGFFSESVAAPTPLAAPHDQAAPLEARARSYLQMNCSTCHRKQGGGTANFNFNITNSLEDNNFVDEVPAQGKFGLPDARVFRSGAPYQSVMLYRMLKSGRGHMPQFGSNVIDRAGVQLIHDWIASTDEDNPQHRQWRREIASFASQQVDPDAKLDQLLASPSGAIALSVACSNGSLTDAVTELAVRRGSEHADATIRDLFEHFLPRRPTREAARCHH